jgi:hypothetical protein
MTGNEINVQIPQNLDPVYSNMVQIAFKSDEFTMMFLHQLPAVNQAKTKAIVSISPSHAKKLLAALQKSINDYEERFGSITPSTQSEGGTDGFTLRGYS